MNRKRLAVIGIRGFPNVQGGVESHCQSLVPLIANHFDCVVYRRKPYLSEQSASAVYPGISFVDLPSTRIGGFESVLHTFLACIHLLFHRADVINVHNIGPGMFTPLLKLFGYKVVLTYHSPNYEHDKWSRGAKLLLRLSEKLSLGFADRIIFVSPFQRAKYPQKILDKSLAISNGINRMPPAKSTNFLKKFGIREGQYLLGVGRLTPEKGFDVLIKAASMLPEISQVVIAGASDHSGMTETRLKELDTEGKVIFTGFTSGSDLTELYDNARAYVLSSRAEGFPMVLLEAMSRKLPVIASDIPAAHIIPLPDSNYAAPDNPEDLARAIRRVIANSPQRVDYDLTPYDWDRIAAQTVDVYKGLLK